MMLKAWAPLNRKTKLMLPYIAYTDAQKFELLAGTEWVEVLISPLTKWRVWSMEHNAWWGVSRTGYVMDRNEAGIYDYEAACDIVRKANLYCPDKPQEAMIAVSKDL